MRLLPAITLCVAALGCSGSYRYCLRLQTAGHMDAEQCNRECKRGHEDVEYEYLRCLQACPGVAITQNDRCNDEDVAPGRICRVTDMKLEGSHSDTPGMAETLAGVATLAMIGLAAVGDSDTSSSSSSQSEGDSSSGSGSSKVKHPTAPGKTHKASDAGKPHRPAKATKSD